MGHIRLLDYFESLKKGTSEKCTTISKKALKHPKRPKWPEVPKKYKEIQRAKTVQNGIRKKQKFAGKRPKKPNKLKAAQYGPEGLESETLPYSEEVG